MNSASNYTNKHKKGISWRPARKSKPWPNEAISWSEIKDDYPVSMGPCEALAYMVKKMKKQGLMSCSNEAPTDSGIKKAKGKHLRDWHNDN